MLQVRAQVFVAPIHEEHRIQRKVMFLHGGHDAERGLVSRREVAIEIDEFSRVPSGVQNHLREHRPSIVQSHHRVIRIAVIAMFDARDAKLHPLLHRAREQLLLELFPIHLRVRSIQHFPFGVRIIDNHARLVPHGAITIIEPQRLKFIAPHSVIIQPRRQRRRIHERDA